MHLPAFDIRGKKKVAALELQLAELRQSYSGRTRLFSLVLNPQQIRDILLPLVPSIQIESSAALGMFVITGHYKIDEPPKYPQQVAIVLNQYIEAGISGVLRSG